MPEYVLSPYIHSIESHLDPANIRHALFHQLTGEISEPTSHVRNLLWAARLGAKLTFEPEELPQLGDLGLSVLELIEKHFLVISSVDPFELFLDHYPVRPIHNPAVSYRKPSGDLAIVRMSMAKRICSPAPGEFERIIEETLPSPEAEILAHADGSATLREIFTLLKIPNSKGRSAVELLSSPERQLIKLTRNVSLVHDPNQPCNWVPRSFYHSARWQGSSNGVSSIAEFHQKGIADANWEFDLIEPTVNHMFRFPSQALGGMTYGARFCEAVRGEISWEASRTLDILEVGGGTGSFARSFLTHANGAGRALNYHILELSRALAANQKRLLAAEGFGVEHFEQDAISFSIPDRKFDVLIANEVIADFPISWVRKSDHSDEESWVGEGSSYLKKYDLSLDGAPVSFRLNSGVFEFIERSWEHLRPGGTAILTEYGDIDDFPVQILHLNHEEFSIHFGYVKRCAEKIGFKCRLLSLVGFLQIDEDIPTLAGNDQHIVCLNQVLKRFNQSLPFAAITKSDFETRFQASLDQMDVTGPRFVPLRSGYHYGPPLNEFKVLIMHKPS